MTRASYLLIREAPGQAGSIVYTAQSLEEVNARLAQLDELRQDLSILGIQTPTIRIEVWERASLAQRATGLQPRPVSPHDAEEA